MIKQIFLMVIFLLNVRPVLAQQRYIDSLRNEIDVSKNDTISLILLAKIANLYSESNPDSAYRYAEKMFGISKKLALKQEEMAALGEMGYALLNVNNYPRSLQILLSAISIGEDPASENKILPARFPDIDEFTDRKTPAHMQRLARLSRVMQYTAILYRNSGNYKKSLQYYRIAIPLAEEAKSLPVLSICYTTLGRTYFLMQKPDSALFCLRKAYDYAIQDNYDRYLGSILLTMGRVYLLEGQTKTAKGYLQKALNASAQQGYSRGVVSSHVELAKIYKQYGKTDSSRYHILGGLSVARQLNIPELLMNCYTALADFYKNVNSDSTVKYQSLIIKIKDDIYNSKKTQDFQNIDFDAQQHQQEILAAKKDYQDRQQKYFLLAGLTLFLFLAIFLWRNNLQRQKMNSILQEQKKEIEITLINLKSTQSQLIQSEKMASLGELTAGIAHEIQNPLNFVNNFSEINTELILEMKEALAKGNVDEAKAIADTIDENENKITSHGKRADGIVKSMLQHSRTSTGVKEPTDINALADEYLRLAYHGLRAKDKSFNATMKTDFDPVIGNINIIPQDIGRVILNLITNAFYAVTEKKKGLPEGFEPTVSVSTKKLGDKVLVSVKDNGNGIPQKMLDKIFQPFFTTKPTGQGTGLGLSLSYDIVKAHGGEIKVQTKEGEGSEFIIQLSVLS